MMYNNNALAHLLLPKREFLTKLNIPLYLPTLFNST